MPLRHQQIAIVDYGVGNLHSVSKAVKLVADNADVLITNNHDDINNADRIIFPGVGAMGDCMAAIHQHQLVELMQTQAHEKPVLGICVGMQALMKSSCEHSQDIMGLGLFDAEVQWFNQETSIQNSELKVPHMGWNTITMNEHALWHGINPEQRFYFVHSYFVPCSQLPTNQIAASCHYGVNFAAAVVKDSLFAVQFHPEKSHVSGLKLLKNFTNWL